MKKNHLHPAFLTAWIGCFLLLILACESDDFEPMTHVGDLELTTMAEMKQFYEDGITEVTGRLDIGIYNVGESDITNLEYLSRLQRVGDRLSVSGIDITSLKGLHSVESVRELQLRYLPMIPKLDYLTSLQSGSLAILGLPSLESLEGLDAMGPHMDELKIYFCTSLTDLTGMEFLESAGIIWLTDNGFTSLKGLENLESFREGFPLSSSGGVFTVQRHQELTDLCGIQNLLNGGNFTGPFVTRYNSFNPTAEDIISGNCKAE